MVESNIQPENPEQERPLILLTGATGYGLHWQPPSSSFPSAESGVRCLVLVTPATYEVGRHLIEGLKNPTVVRDKKALQVFNIHPVGIKEAMRQALEEAGQIEAKQ